MPKSSSSRANNGSEVSSSRSERRRKDDDKERTRSRGESITSSSSKKKSSRRDDGEREGSFQPTSTSFSSSSQSPYAGVAAPSVASSYATAYTNEPTSVRPPPPDLVRNESLAEKLPSAERKASRRESRRESKGETSRGVEESDDDTRNERRRESEKRRRDSTKSEKSRRESARGNTDENHRASLVQNQFPGEFPDSFAEPYRPPGLAADYYGDHGESVQYQPGVRPQPPSIIQTADQAHLHEPTVDAKPPPEPSSLGQVGAAASFYSMAGEDETANVGTPAKPARKQSLQAVVHSNMGASPRSSPGPEVRPSTGRMPSGAPNGGGIGNVGSAAMAAGAGLAAEYYTGDISITGPNDPPPGTPGQASQGYAQSTNSYQKAHTDASSITAETPSARPQRPSAEPSSSSNVPLYEAAAVAGLAGVAASAYHSGHSHAEQQQSSQFQDNPPFVLGQNQSAFPAQQQQQQQQQQRHRHKHRSPLGKFVDWFRDPQAVAEYEQYTEAIGVCKHCFDPNSSPLDAPRKHHYKSRRYSGSRYGSSTRVDKLTRYSSDEERRRRSTTKKVIAGGIAAAGAAKIGEALYNQKNDFDDTYSVKSGRPANSSRVSFKEDEERYSSRRKKYSDSEDRETTRRRSRKSSETNEERSSRKRYSGAPEGISRGTVLSTGIAAAGIAAAASDRRRSRSRSKSPTKKKYYSKTISPRHSYVDLSTTNSGTLGFGDFFSSPSANTRRGKKKKGLFNFSNGSSSSSDADLIFGEGTVKRKSRRRTDKKTDDGGDTAAILGLAAAGAALAAESGRRESQGRRKQSDVRIGRESESVSRRSNRISLNDHADSDSVNGNEDVWEDASGDDASSVDTALAYGGRLSARQSRESLASNEGTGKWNWRWNKKAEEKEKDKEKERKRRTSSRPESAGINPAAAGLVGAAIGAGMASMNQSPAVASTPGSLPPMRYVDPVATTDPTIFDIRQASVITEVSPRSSAPLMTSPSIPLQQPQPITPISANIYDARQLSSAPSGPPVFDRDWKSSRITESPKQISADVTPVYAPSGRRSGRRRDSSPAALPSRESVKFDLTEEQLDQERRAEERERKRLRKEDREKRRLRDLEYVAPSSVPQRTEETESRGKSDRRGSADARAAREAEIEAELERLYEEDRQQRDSRKRSSSSTDIATAAAAVGAGIVAATVINRANASSGEEDEKEQEESRAERRSSLRKSRDRDVSDSESQQERIARMAAQRVRSTPSPVYEDYGTFFVPPELAKDVKEHNDKAEHRDDMRLDDAQVVEVEPRSLKEKKEWFDEFTYRPFGLEPEDDPRLYPWPVPHLALIEPSPPHSPELKSKAWKEEVEERDYDVQEVVPASVSERSARSSSGSRVTWGDHDTYVYEVQTPEWERANEIFDTDGGTAKVHSIDDEDSEPLKQIPPVEKMTKDQLEHLAKGGDFRDLPPSQIEPKAPTPVVDVEERQPAPSSQKGLNREVDFAKVVAAARAAANASAAAAAATAVSGMGPKIVADVAPLPQQHQQDASGVSGSERSFYQSPFSETVSDLGNMTDYSTIPARGSGFVEDAEVPPTPRDEITPDNSGVSQARDFAGPSDVEGAVSSTRPSRSDARRQERAASKTSPEAPNSVSSVEPQSVPVEPRASVSIAEPAVSGGFNVFDYLVEEKGSTIPTASVMGAAALGAKEAAEKARKRANRSSEVYIPRNEEKNGEQEPRDFGKPRRATTFDESKFDAATVQTPKSKSGYASDPEDWEKSSTKKSKQKSSLIKDGNILGKAAIVGAASIASAPIIEDFYEGKKSKRKSKRDSEIFDDDAKSIASSPASYAEKDDQDNSKKAKRRSKRDSEIFDDDDTKSVASSATTTKSEKESKRKSKDSGKKSGGFFGLFSSSKSDASTSSRKSKFTNSEDGERKKQKSREKETMVDDTASIVSEGRRRSRSASQSSVKAPMREESVEDGFVSAEEEATGKNGAKPGSEEEESFLAQRPEMSAPAVELKPTPMDTDGVSGLVEEKHHLDEPLVEADAMRGVPKDIVAASSQAVQSEVTPIVDRERSVSPKTSAAPPDTIDESAIQSSPLATREVRPRRLSNLRTTDLASSPGLVSSPTAVPLLFRRLPISPGNIRPGSFGSPASPGASSPLTPRTRQGRPHSTDMRTSIKEVRPLYLVERHSSARNTTPEVEETYPSLPSSRTTSAHPSIENLRGDYEHDQPPSHSQDDYFLPTDRISPELFRDRTRRQSYSAYWDRPKSAEDDYLDSGQATPTAASPGLSKKDVPKEKPKYEFHSPSELLQDPSQFAVEETLASPLPSVVGSEDYLSAKSRSRSPSPVRESNDHGDGKAAAVVGLGVVGGAAAALVGSKLLKDQTGTQETMSQDFLPENQDNAKHLESLPLLSTNNTTIRDPTDRREQEATPLTAIPSLIRDSTVQPANEAAIVEDDSKNINPSRDGESLAGNTETQAIAPADATREVAVEDEVTLTRHDSFVPSMDEVNKPQNELTAFEEAFERARKSRGLSGSTTREEAMASFLPKRENAPFIEHGTLTPIGEMSKVPSPADTPAEVSPVEEVVAVESKGKKNKAKSKKEKRKSSKLKDMMVEEGQNDAEEKTKDGIENAEKGDDASVVATGVGIAAAATTATLLTATPHKNPFGDDFDIPSAEQGEYAAEPEETPLAEPLLGKNPFGDDFDVKQDGSEAIKDLPEITEADAAVDPPDEFTQRPKSKKDKKNKRKSQATLLEAETVEPASEDVPEPVLPEPDTEISSEKPKGMVDDFKTPSGKKGKKSKKKSKTLDWEDSDPLIDAPQQDKTTLGGEIVAEPGDFQPDEDAARDIETKPNEPASESAGIDESQIEAPEADVEDFAPISGKKSKKDKKDKKKKSKSLAWEETPEDETSTGGPATPAEPQLAVEDQPLVQEDEDDFSMPTSKRGKKEKKKKSKTIDADEPTMISVPEVSNEPVEESSRDVEAESEPTTQSIVDAEPSLTVEEDASAPKDKVDEFATQTSKKGKKNKKKSQVLDWETAAPVLAAAPVIAAAVDKSDETEQQDDWATPKSSKKEKKQKSRKSSVILPEANSQTESEVDLKSAGVAPTEPVVHDYEHNDAHLDWLGQAGKLSNDFPVRSVGTAIAPDQAERAELEPEIDHYQHDAPHQEWLGKASEMAAVFPGKEEAATESVQEPVTAKENVDAADPYAHDSAHQEWLGKATEMAAQFQDRNAVPSEPKAVSEEPDIYSGVDRYAHDSAHQEWLGQAGTLAGRFLDGLSLPAQVSTATGQEVAKQSDDGQHIQDDAHQESLGKAGEIASAFPDGESGVVEPLQSPKEQVIMESEQDKYAHDKEHQGWLDQAYEASSAFPDVRSAQTSVTAIPGQDVVNESDHDKYAHDAAHEEWLQQAHHASSVFPDSRKAADEASTAIIEPDTDSLRDAPTIQPSTEATVLSQENKKQAGDDAVPEVTQELPEGQADEFAWTTSKKSKKDKKKSKKRTSTVDDLSELPTPAEESRDIPVGAGAVAAGTLASATAALAAESPASTPFATPGETPGEQVQDFSWAPTKKGKKSKKGRKSDIAFEATPELSSAAEDTPTQEPPVVEAASAEQESRDVPEIEGDEFAFTSKQSKKDKKKQKRESTKQESEVDPDALAAALAADESSEREPSKEEPSVAPEALAAALAATAPGSEMLPTNDKEVKSGSDTAIDISPPETAAVDAAREAARVEEPIPTAEEEEWGFSTKKSKKDKKKKRQATSEIVTPAEDRGLDAQSDPKLLMEGPREKTTEPHDVLGEEKLDQAAIASSAVEPPRSSQLDIDALLAEADARDGVESISTSEEKKIPAQVENHEEPSRPQPDVNALLAEAEARESLKENSDDILPEQKETEPAEEEWGFPSKKSKKEKKKNRRQSTFDDVETEDNQTKDLVDEQIKPAAAAAEEAWAPTPKKSKKDKKKKKTLLSLDDVEDEDSTSQSRGTETPIRGEVEGIAQSARQVDDGVVAMPGAFGVDDVEMMDEPRELNQTEEDEREQRKKSKSGKKEKKRKKSLMNNPEAVVEGEVESLRQQVEEPHQQENVDVESGREVVGDQHNPRHQSDEPLERRPETPPSEAASSRERRRRRRSPIVWTGEEPGDLPGARSLTPREEQDTSMDTALSVAAGLGLTGAAIAAGTSQNRGHTEKKEESRQQGEARSAVKTQENSDWSFAKLGPTKEIAEQTQHRDSGVQLSDSPTVVQDRFQSTRDSGYVPSPVARTSWAETAVQSHDGGITSRRRPQSPTSSSEDVHEANRRSNGLSHFPEGKENRSKVRETVHEQSRDLLETPGRRQPSPVDSTTKDRSSKLFDSSPLTTRTDPNGATPKIDTKYLPSPSTDIHRSPSIHGHHRSREELRAMSPHQGTSRSIGPERHPIPHLPTDSGMHRDQTESTFSPRHSREFSADRPFSPPKTPLGTIHENFPELNPSHRRQHEVFDDEMTDQHKSLHRETPQHDLRAAAGITGLAGLAGAAALVGASGAEASRDSTSTSRTKSLGKSKSRTSSSRQLRSQYETNTFASSSSHSLVDDKGKGAARDMADVFDGYGEHPGSPMSPTRPPSVRKRQSMQQIRDLEARVDQLANENRALAEAKIAAERDLDSYHHDRSQTDYATQESMQSVNAQLREKDENILHLRQGLDNLQEEVARLTEVNKELTIAHATLSTDHEKRYSALLDEHQNTHASWQESSRDLDTLKEQHAELSTGMEDIVRHEIDTAMAEKNAEIDRLQSQLEDAKEQIRELQQQILVTQTDVIVTHDEDYFDNACQQLCQHVQQWVLRFSKFSDTRVCRTTNEVRDEKVVDRFDNAILDGSDVDEYLADRVKRRDVFMSVVMTMIWDFIFTRYLFGMDREQRQKLKQLEKNLSEVGQPSAVHQWRAMTLTLLSKREVFQSQKESDTEAVVIEVLGTLSRFLPPPSNLEKQITDSLRNVMRAAVDLSIEMRTQRAEYIMLPPLQPEYDTNGDLARKVYFNASLMNERSGQTTSNDELEASEAVVRIVLFPLVVKKGGVGEDGEWLGDEEVVVCPAQVLVARADAEDTKGKRAVSAADRMSVGQRESLRAVSRGSVQSFVSNGHGSTGRVTSGSAVDTGMGNMI